MIREIQFIYILDPSGNPIFIRENYIQGSEEFNHSLLSGFISALQSFASEFAFANLVFTSAALVNVEIKPTFYRIAS